MVVPVLVTWRWFTWIVFISSQASVHKCPLCSPLVAWNLALRAWHSFLYSSVCVFFAVVFAFELVFVFCISICLCSPLVAWSPARQAWHSSCSSQSWTRREAPPLASGSPSSSRSANTLNRCHLLHFSWMEQLHTRKYFQDIFYFIDCGGRAHSVPLL